MRNQQKVIFCEVVLFDMFPSHYVEISNTISGLADGTIFLNLLFVVVGLEGLVLIKKPLDFNERDLTNQCSYVYRTSWLFVEDALLGNIHSF